MITETRKTLLNLISEYGDSLNRVDAERELMKAMEERADVECHITVKAFRTAATAYYKDSVAKKREELTEQVDLFAMIQEEASPQ